MQKKREMKKGRKEYGSYKWGWAGQITTEAGTIVLARKLCRLDVFFPAKRNFPAGNVGKWAVSGPMPSGRGWNLDLISRW